MMSLERASELWHVLGWSSYGDEILEDVIQRYNEPHRHYHSLDHVLSILPLVQHERPPVILAAWLHDVIYDPRRSDNEELSAEYAGNYLGGRYSDEFERSVCSMILDTKTHEPSVRHSERLLDADLSILAAPERVYAVYARQIQEEYSFVSEEQYRMGRTAVLQRLLNRAEKNRLFRTDLVPYPEQALHNLHWEIDLLAA